MVLIKMVDLSTKAFINIIVLIRMVDLSTKALINIIVLIRIVDLFTKAAHRLQTARHRIKLRTSSRTKI